MSYQITITQVTREQVKSRSWENIGKDAEGEIKYGYVDNETTEDISREVYTQRVEDLDLKAVIDAVNKEGK